MLWVYSILERRRSGTHFYVLDVIVDEDILVWTETAYYNKTIIEHSLKSV